MPAPARAAAFRALSDVSAGRVDLGEALTRARDPLAASRDRALATDLTVGTLRWRGALDYQLQRLSTKPLHRMDAAVLDALRLGAYQILHLERVPISAVVNDSVNLVKASGVRSAAGFANAVLRRLARERDMLVWPDRQDLVSYLSTVHSHPAWLVRRWLDRYGEGDTEHRLRFNNEPPALTLATNRLLGTRAELEARLRAEGVAAAPTLTAAAGLAVTAGRALTSAAFREGYCVVQDEASQIIPELLQARPGERLLDACASPGGKTLAAAAQCGPSGWVVATDVRWRRIQLLTATLARCRAANVQVVQIGNTSPFPFLDAAFDRVLIDAPCSGLGTVRRDPDIRWRREPSQFAALAQTQRDLLDRVRPLVAPGGRIVYSTCSSEPEENEDVVAAFLETAPEFSVLPLASADLAPSIVAMQTEAGYLRTTSAFGLEAFFAAILHRR
jgi:16S rRNA (cytosine967-C5)-methyltransferase